MRLRALALAVVAVVLLGGSACTNDSKKTESAAGRDGGVAGAVDKQPDDVEAERLKEPVPKRNIDKLQEQAARVFGVCEMWQELDKIDPPDPRNRVETSKHAERMFATFKLFDPTKAVNERVDAGRGRAEFVRKILPPNDVLSDIKELRGVWYAHWVRLSTYHQWYEAGTIDEAGLQRRTSNAFLILTGDEQTKAQRRLAEFEVTHCHL